VTVNFLVTTGGGTIANPSVTTDEGGVASPGSWALGTIAGIQTIRAAAVGVQGSVVIFATAKPGPTTSLAKVGAEPAASPIGSTIDSIVVLATDKFGNPVPGQTVAFTVTAGGGTVSPASRSTLADGRAAAQWTLGNLLDVQNLASAALPDGSLPVAFSTLSTRPVAAVRFVEHVLVVDSAQTIMPAIALLDVAGNNVPGATVSLATRNVNVATAGSGTATGSKSGQTFLVATSTDNSVLRDSAVLIVASAGKPAVFLTMPRFDLKGDTTFTVSVMVDSRSPTVAIGAATLQVVWNPSVVSFVSQQAGSSTAFVDINTNAAAGVAAIAMVSSAGITGTAEIRRLTFKASTVVGRAGSLSVDVIDMAAATTFANLVAQTVSAVYPVRIR
jgi:hypothetical protein